MLRLVYHWYTCDMANYNPKEYLKDHQFEPLGKEALSRIPVSVKLPKDLDEYVRALPNRNRWITEAILEKALKEID